MEPRANTRKFPQNFETKINDLIKVDVTSGFDLEYEMNFIALNDFEEDIEFKFWASPTK